jgi:Transglycosylase-like domain
LAHAPGCRSARCDHHAYRLWLKHHPFRFTAFELCVAGRESGAGEVVTRANARRYAHDIRWRYVGEDYEGAYNWVNSTWLAMGGARYAEHANEATPREQTLIFRAHANSQDWPVTVPACE